jgi:hypothetical protein
VSWIRLRLALPLLGLSALFLAFALIGAVSWWSESGGLDRFLTVTICVLLAAAVVVSISISIGPRRSEIPWVLVGVVVAANLSACLVTLLRETLAQS